MDRVLMSTSRQLKSSLDVNAVKKSITDGIQEIRNTTAMNPYVIRDCMLACMAELFSRGPSLVNLNSIISNPDYKYVVTALLQLKINAENSLDAPLTDLEWIEAWGTVLLQINKDLYLTSGEYF